MYIITKLPQKYTPLTQNEKNHYKRYCKNAQYKYLYSVPSA